MSFAGLLLFSILTLCPEPSRLWVDTEEPRLKRSTDLLLLLTCCEVLPCSCIIPAICSSVEIDSDSFHQFLPKSVCQSSRPPLCKLAVRRCHTTIVSQTLNILSGLNLRSMFQLCRTTVKLCRVQLLRLRRWRLQLFSTAVPSSSMLPTWGQERSGAGVGLPLAGLPPVINIS